MRNAFVAAIAAFVVAVAPAAAAAQCHAVRGMRVTLFGGVDDPDVLVWDSRDRLKSFSSGSTDTRKFLLPHAFLALPGTVAVVQACLPGIVHPKFRLDAEDAVGVLLESGKYRGRYGWISSADVHGAGIPEPEVQW